jgi:hypothetical protein
MENGFRLAPIQTVTEELPPIQDSFIERPINSIKKHEIYTSTSNGNSFKQDKVEVSDLQTNASLALADLPQ